MYHHQLSSPNPPCSKFIMTICIIQFFSYFMWPNLYFVIHLNFAVKNVRRRMVDVTKYTKDIQVTYRNRPKTYKRRIEIDQRHIGDISKQTKDIQATYRNRPKIYRRHIEIDQRHKGDISKCIEDIYGQHIQIDQKHMVAVSKYTKDNYNTTQFSQFNIKISYTSKFTIS